MNAIDLDYIISLFDAQVLFNLRSNHEWLNWRSHSGAHTSCDPHRSKPPSNGHIRDLPTSLSFFSCLFASLKIFSCMNANLLMTDGADTQMGHGQVAALLTFGALVLNVWSDLPLPLV